MVVEIPWPLEQVVASRKSEARVSQVLHRKGEWGRGRDLPADRLREIEDACNRNGMNLFQALSMRRSMLRAMPGGMNKVNRSSAMGSNQGQQDIARLLEEATVQYIKDTITRKVGKKSASSYFLTEREQLDEMRRGTRPRGPTPDILFLKPVKIQGKQVHWIDCKMFYGSAMMASKRHIPNGKLEKTADRYASHFGGKGAFVFGRGFCHDLRPLIRNAVLLDSAPLDTSAIEDFQNDG